MNVIMMKKGFVGQYLSTTEIHNEIGTVSTKTNFRYIKTYGLKQFLAATCYDLNFL